MPWKETCPMDQRLVLIADWLREEWTITELARRYGGEAEDGLQVGGSVCRGSRARAGGAVAGAEASWTGDSWRCCTGGSRRRCGRRRARSAICCAAKGRV